MLRKIASGLFWAVPLVLFTSTMSTAQIPPKLLALVQEKAKIALALSEPASRCVQRKDTRHAAFHGCIDWHSAVHGTWALVAYTAMTGDRRYENLIGSILTGDKLAQEHALLRSTPGFEMPYGRAWLLRLAIEHERHYRDGKLLPLADVAASSLEAHYRANPPKPLSFTYDNSAWALINLLDYYQFRERQDSVERIKALARRAFFDHKAQCDPRAERPGFMATCTNWAWIVSKVVKRTEFIEWSSIFVPPALLRAPVLDPRSAHEYGLNFSRAWGLWELFSITKTPEYLDSYVDNFRATYEDRNNWDGDYQTVGHWVPQFGMFAVQPLFGPEFR